MCCEWKQPSPAELLLWILCRRSSRKKFTFSSQESLKAPQRKPHKPDSVHFSEDLTKNSQSSPNLRVPVLLHQLHWYKSQFKVWWFSFRRGSVLNTWTKCAKGPVWDKDGAQVPERVCCKNVPQQLGEALCVSVSVVMTVTALVITSNIQKHAEESKTTFYWSSLRTWSRKSGLTSLWVGFRLCWAQLTQIKSGSGLLTQTSGVWRLCSCL